MENKENNIMQHILGMQEGFLLPEHVKRISRFRFIRNFALDNAGTEMLKRIALGFIFPVVVPIHCKSGLLLLLMLLSLLILLK